MHELLHDVDILHGIYPSHHFQAMKGPGPEYVSIQVRLHVRGCVDACDVIPHLC